MKTDLAVKWNMWRRAQGSLGMAGHMNSGCKWESRIQTQSYDELNTKYVGKGRTLPCGAYPILTGGGFNLVHLRGSSQGRKVRIHASEGDAHKGIHTPNDYLALNTPRSIGWDLVRLEIDVSFDSQLHIRLNEGRNTTPRLRKTKMYAFWWSMITQAEQYS